MSPALVGLDLGQQNDYTVLSTLLVDDIGTHKNYSLVYLKKYGLKTPYPEIVHDVALFIKRADLGSDYRLVIDATGVGRPVVDLFRELSLSIVAVTITGGMTSNFKGNSEVTAPKKDIISSLQVVMQNKRLNISSGVDFLEDLKREFLNFKYTLRDKGSSSFSAAHGHHDDIVMSIGMAVWFGEGAGRKGRRVRIVSG